MGHDKYYYSQGIYYCHDPKGYRVVRPPRGIVVTYLPLGFETLIIAGIAYFVFAGIYYQAVPTGYVVVEPPLIVGSPVVYMPGVIGQVLAVDVSLLNVRSGPGMNYPVVYQVRPGDSLVIQGTAPGWYYVQLPNGAFGWVMSTYTHLVAPAAG